MRRATIADLSKVSGVSTSTINRLLGGRAKVRPETIQRVRNAAEEIGFYGLGTLLEREKDALPHYRLGVLLQQSNRQIYQLFGSSIVDAARMRKDARIETTVNFVDELSPDSISKALFRLGERVNAIAVVCADHPQISQTINVLRERGVPTIAYITDLSAPNRAGYVGTDNWKLGRTAAYIVANMVKRQGKIATFIGNHRYQCQDISDASFRSYVREHARHMTVMDAFMTNEESDVAYDLVRDLFAKEHDLVGLYVIGGGISGVLRAIRELPEEHRSEIRVVCRDVGTATRTGLNEGLITAALCHPLGRTSNELINTMIEAIGQDKNAAIIQRTVPFEILTPENV
ncbi:LacI family DNA-binding transcriptional regulator [Pararhizobium sp. A13]|uniref:LacI family DNA-binding transcriptional regulator n=1 Tax=Pararhizobium sp. A13 TaxID=3133975 RepID=UPI00324C70BA